MTRSDSAQLMVMAAVMIAMGMAALAFISYSATTAGETPAAAVMDDSSRMFDNLKQAYGQAAKRAYDRDPDNPGPYLETYGENLTRYAERHGYSVVLTPRNESDGYDLSGDTFTGNITATDGSSTYTDELTVDLGN